MLTIVTSAHGAESSDFFRALVAANPSHLAPAAGFASPTRGDRFVAAPLLVDLAARSSVDNNRQYLVASSIGSPEIRDRVLAHLSTAVICLDESIESILHSRWKESQLFPDSFEEYFWAHGNGMSWSYAAHQAVWEPASERTVHVGHSSISQEACRELEALGLGVPEMPGRVDRIVVADKIEARLRHVEKWTAVSIEEQPTLDTDYLRIQAENRPERLASDDAGRREGISIVTPVFNDAVHIRQTIESVLSQGHTALEYIIVDGGSTDGTVAIIEEYEADLAYWISEPDEGHADAVNKGFAKSTGSIMAWLNSADLYYAGAFETVVEVFGEHPEISWLQGMPNFIDERGTTVAVNRRHGVWCQHDYLMTEFTHQHIQQEATFWKRSLWDAAGGYLDTDYSLANDCELWQRFFHHATLHNIECLLGGFRIHEGQRSVDQLSEYRREAAEILERERRCLGISRADSESLRYESPVLPPLIYNMETQRYERRDDDHFRAREPWDQFRKTSDHHNRALRRIADLEKELAEAKKTRQ